jgi:Kyakuja-Dileera-Zisupton transposase
VNFDFPLVHNLRKIMGYGLKRVVISYDIACKYHINFLKRLTAPEWPLISSEEEHYLKSMTIKWLVPKYHLAAHVEQCADKFSFNYTANVGRTHGEIVESNWAGLGALATATREMGFGNRRDTLTDVMSHWNWAKATNEGEPLASGCQVDR